MTALDILRQGGDFSRYGRLPAFQPTAPHYLEEAKYVARRVADLLKSDYGAKRVILYGSLARGFFFNDSSDIDLAAWGISNGQYLDAIGLTMDYESRWPVNLTMGEDCKGSYLAAILRDGIVL